MLFNSWQFFLFFPIVTIAYFLLSDRARIYWLLAASCVFYMAFVPAFLAILAATITVDYLAGIAIAEATGRRRKLLLACSILVNVGMLASFKYINFVSENLAALASLVHWNYPLSALAVVLPIGLSFHVFQSMAYTIEVYRGHQEPERDYWVLALYVMFYPQLVAGPIERPQNLLPQFHALHRFDGDRVASGLRLMLWGFFEKVVIADRCAVLVDPIFAAPAHYTGLTLCAAAVLFSFQIFCDFAGYSDIARGAARVMGYELMVNFRRPYLSASIAEFWTRWHIALSTWFRDYLYIPLGGNRVSKPRWLANLLIVFLVSGLWHGAAWTFVIWGALHGGYMAAAILTADARAWLGARLGLARLPALVRRGVAVATTFALVTFAWIFFRAASFADAWYFATHLHLGWAAQLSSFGALSQALHLGGSRTQLSIALLAIAALLAVHVAQERLGPALDPGRWPIALRWPAYYAGALVVLVLGVFNGRTFIYFQF